MKLYTECYESLCEKRRKKRASRVLWRRRFFSAARQLWTSVVHLKSPTGGGAEENCGERGRLAACDGAAVAGWGCSTTCGTRLLQAQGCKFPGPSPEHARIAADPLVPTT